MAAFEMRDVLKGPKRCPHCGVAVPHLSKQWGSPAYLVNHKENGFSTMRQWATYQCSSCKGIILACGSAYIEDDRGHVNFGKPLDVETIFPSSKTVDDSLPPPARHYLQQALETLHAPDAAAVMAASAVDSMLKERGYQEGSLYRRIDKAVEDHLLTEGMGKWAHAVRLEANAVRHADAEDPHLTAPEAKRVVDFAFALGDFLYVLTSRVDAGIASSEGRS
jgi:hypothetical protein